MLISTCNRAFVQNMMVNEIAINFLLQEPQGLLLWSQKVVTEPRFAAEYTIYNNNNENNNNNNPAKQIKTYE
jgi:hypothetical protein